MSNRRNFVKSLTGGVVGFGCCSKAYSVSERSEKEEIESIHPDLLEIRSAINTLSLPRNILKTKYVSDDLIEFGDDKNMYFSHDLNKLSAVFRTVGGTVSERQKSKEILIPLFEIALGIVPSSQRRKTDDNSLKSDNILKMRTNISKSAIVKAFCDTESSEFLDLLEGSVQADHIICSDDYKGIENLCKKILGHCDNNHLHVIYDSDRWVKPVFSGEKSERTIHASNRLRSKSYFIVGSLDDLGVMIVNKNLQYDDNQGAWERIGLCIDDSFPIIKVVEV